MIIIPFIWNESKEKKWFNKMKINCTNREYEYSVIVTWLSAITLSKTKNISDMNVQPFSPVCH